MLHPVRWGAFARQHPARLRILHAQGAELSKTRFSAISNATELFAYDGLLGPGQIEWLQVTLDGPPDEHDKSRIRTDGSGSWDAIAKNVTFALEQGCVINVRMNLDRNNIDQLDRLAEEMERLGWWSYDAPAQPGYEVGGRTNRR